MSAPTGPSSKGEKGKSKYRSLDINNIYSSSRSDNSETQQTKSTAPRRHGMQNLGKVPRRPPVNLPSIRAESSGNDPSVSLIQHGAPGWGLKSGEGSGSGTAGQVESQQTTSTASAAPVVAAPPAAVPAATQTPAPTAAPAPAVGGSLPSGDKTWSSVMSGGSTPTVNGPDRGPPFLAHQSPQFQQEFPSLSGEPGAPPAHPAAHYGPGPALRPQSEGSWSSRQPPAQPQPPTAIYDSVVPQFLMRADASGFPSFPDSIQTSRPRSQNNTNSESRVTSNTSSSAHGGRAPPMPESDELIPRPIVRDEDLHRMDELARDDSWAANDDIDYNEKLAFSDSESLGEDEKEKENKLKDKNKISFSNKDDKKEMDLDKGARDKPQFTERSQPPPPLEQWRTPQNYSPNDYRNNSRSHQPLRVDDSEMDMKRRQVKQTKMVASEKAKQRKEEEEKRFEESRGKKKDESSDFHSNAIPSAMSEWEKDDRLKSSETFKQMTQGSFKFPLESGPPGRDRERDMRKDRDNQSFRYPHKVPRFNNRNNKQGQYGGNSGFDSKWNHGPQHMTGRRPHDDKDDDRKERINESSDRLRHNLRDDRNRDDLNKRNYYDHSHHSHFTSQSAYPALSREIDNQDKDVAIKESEKDLSEREGKEWECLKADMGDNRPLDDRLRKDLKSQSDNYSKSLDQFEERPQRPESRDRPSRPDSRDSRASKDSRNSREDNRSLPTPREGDFWPDEFEKEKLPERHPFKEKDMTRRDLPHRMRDHVPGPITPQKVEAHEHKHSLTVLVDKKDKDIEAKVPKSEEVEGSSVWQSSVEEKPTVQPLMDSVKTMPDLSRDDEIHEDLDKSKEDGDKKKEGMRDRRDDKGVRGGNRNNRSSRTLGNYNSSSNSGGYGSSMRNSGWNNNRDQSTWKTDKNLRDDKQKDNKLESDKTLKSLGDKKAMSGGQGRQDGRKSDGGFAPRGEPSRRGRGGGGAHQRGGSHFMTGSHYGPPGNKPFTSTSAPPLSQLQIDLQDKQFSPPQPGRKLDDGSSKAEGGKSSNSNSGLNPRNKNRPVGKLSNDTEDCGWETTSETSDSSDKKKSGKGKNKSDKKPNRGTIGDKRGTLNSTHINGRPSREDLEGVESGSEKKTSKDDSDPSSASGPPCEDNGFQEVRSKKMVRPVKEEVKKPKSKPKDKMQGGVKSQNTKNYSREFVSNKPPRMQRLDSMKKQQQQQQQPDVSDMNKINQSASSLFPSIRGNNIGCPPPPPHNAWNKPINETLRTTPPLPSATIAQMSTSTSAIPQEKTLDLGEISQSATSSQTNSPTQEKALSKMTCEVAKGLLDAGPPVNTLIFENKNYKRDNSDKSEYGMNAKRGYATKCRPYEKGRDRKIEDEIHEGNHSNLNLGAFKSEMSNIEGKSQEGIQVPVSFNKNEDSADMKLDDFPFESDLCQLSDDKTIQSAHVGQTSTADLDQKIASVKKVWDTPGVGSNDEPHSASSTFTSTFPNEKILESSGPPHHTDNSDFNAGESMYSTGGQLGSSSSSYAVSSGTMMKGDSSGGVNTICKGAMFQMNSAPPVHLQTNHGSISTPPLLSYPQYAGNISVPSPTSIMFNTPTPNHQNEIYSSFQIHNNSNRSYSEYSSPNHFTMSQNNSFPISFLAATQPAPGAQTVFPNTSPSFRMAHHSTNLSQPMNSNPNVAMMSTTPNSMVSGNQIKSSQPAIGTKTVPSAPNYNSPIFLIDSGFMPGPSYQRSVHHSSSIYNNQVPTGNVGGSLFNSQLQLGNGGVNALNTPNQYNVSGFQGGGNQPSAPTPSGPTSAPPPNQLPQGQFSAQIGGTYRNQGFSKAGQIPGDPAKSPSQDQFSSIFGQGSNMAGVGKQMRVSQKPQTSPSPQPPQQHKFPPYQNSHVSQNSMMYPPGSVQQGVSGNMGAVRSGSGNMVSSAQRTYVAPIQRPGNYHQPAMHMSQRNRQLRQPPPQPGTLNGKAYYPQQVSMKVDNEVAKVDVADDSGKVQQEKSIKDEANAGEQ